MINFLHTFTPQAVAFSAGPLTIHWYGICIVLGIAAALLVVVYFGKAQGVSSDQIFDAAFYVIIFGIVGARLYSICLDWTYYLAHPEQLVAVWNGGLAIHGAILGGSAALVVYAYKKKQSFWRWADLAVLGLPVGQALGRVGNYFNQEIFGLPTSLPWGIPISPEFRPTAYQQFEYFHPTFLYEALLDVLNFLILALVFKPLAIRHSPPAGRLFLIYLINYSVIRIVMEQLRIDAAPEIVNIRWPIIFSGALLLAALAGLVFSRKTKSPVV